LNAITNRVCMYAALRLFVRYPIAFTNTSDYPDLNLQWLYKPKRQTKSCKLYISWALPI